MDFEIGLETSTLLKYWEFHKYPIDELMFLGRCVGRRLINCQIMYWLRDSDEINTSDLRRSSTHYYHRTVTQPLGFPACCCDHVMFLVFLNYYAFQG